MRITTQYLYTEVPDEVEYQEKGLNGSKQFTVVMGLGGPPTGVGTFTLSPMPGCCGVVVSENSNLDERYRGIWVGKQFHEIKAKVAAYFGYKAMIMTTQLRNFPEVIGAAKAGWSFKHSFRNKRTDNDIGIAIKDL